MCLCKHRPRLLPDSSRHAQPKHHMLRTEGASQARRNPDLFPPCSPAYLPAYLLADRPLLDNSLSPLSREQHNSAESLY